MYNQYYFNDAYKFIINKFIYEYDIKQGNINILKRYNLISDDDYNYMCTLPKKERNRKIGLLQKRNKNIPKLLKEGFINTVNEFIVTNNLKNDNILAIKNDAVFIVNRIPLITKIDNVEFIRKNTYTLFNKILNLETFYYYNKLTNNEILDIKGINDNIVDKHKNYIIDFISYIYYLVLIGQVSNAISVLRSFYNQYINRLLDINYYMEFNNKSCFRLYGRYFLKYLDEYYKTDINIEYNKIILIELNKFLSKLYY